MSAKYLSCAETAKLLRQALKESFPGVTFTVKSKTYSGGASIRVGWVDGPTSSQVKSVTDKFEGAYFDGMIDYQGSRYHKLDGEEVHFGANFIFEEREYSDAMVMRAIDAVANHFSDCEPISVEDYRTGRSHSWKQLQGGCDLGRSLSLTLEGRDDPWTVTGGGVNPKIHQMPSATLARVQFAGDDGYGAGTVGRNGKEGEQCYKAISARQAVAS